jgi:hypothetical protein
VVVDRLLGILGLVVDRREPLQALFVRVEAEAVAREGLPCRACTEGSRSESDDGQGDALLERSGRGACTCNEDIRSVPERQQ